jgi:hypothetical protein
MIDTDVFRKKLEARWLVNKFTKLDTPLVVQDLYVAVRPTPEQYENFDFLLWEPAMIAFEESMLWEDYSYYELDVYYVEDVLIICSSRGKISRLSGEIT